MGIDWWDTVRKRVGKEEGRRRGSGTGWRVGERYLMLMDYNSQSMGDSNIASWTPSNSSADLEPRGAVCAMATMHAYRGRAQFARAHVFIYKLRPLLITVAHLILPFHADFHPSILLFCYFHPSILLSFHASILPFIHFSHTLFIAHADHSSRTLSISAESLDSDRR